MGTKNQPGSFDCYANAEPDEPMFVLLGRDPAAALTVAFWCALRDALEPEIELEKQAEALRCARAMWRWAKLRGKGERLARAAEAAAGSVAVEGEADAALSMAALVSYFEAPQLELEARYVATCAAAGNSPEDVAAGRLTIHVGVGVREKP